MSLTNSKDYFKISPHRILAIIYFSHGKFKSFWFLIVSQILSTYLFKDSIIYQYTYW